jgi:tRNA(Ile)-lysidine synthase
MNSTQVLAVVQHRVETFLTAHEEIQAGDLLIVAVSGGPDSCAMLHALSAVSGSLQIQLHCVHVEHGIRGEASVGDAKYTSELCASLGIACTVHSVDAPSLAKSAGISVQLAARRLRHKILQTEANARCVPGRLRIAIGHNASDRAETLLLNAARGSGLDGLTAMPAVDLPYLRPLLSLSRREIEAYCAAAGICPRQDASNSDDHYGRNRIRLSVLPGLALAVDGDPVTALNRLAELAELDANYLNSEAEKLLHSATITSSGGAMRLNTATLIGAHGALRFRALRLAVLKVRGSLEDVSSDAIKRVLTAAEVGEKYHAMLPRWAEGHVSIGHSEGIVTVQPTAKQSAPMPVDEIEIPADGSPVRLGAYLLQMVDTVEQLTQECWPEEDLILAFPAISAQRLFVRQWKPGDYMQPSGMTGTKKLQDLYTDYKIRAADRNAYPVLLRTGSNTARNGEILAVLGLRSSVGTIRVTSAAQLNSDIHGRELTIIRVRPLSI